MLFALPLGLTVLSGVATAAPTGLTTTFQARDDFNTCITKTQGSICQPVQDSPQMAIGDHINLDFVATGVHSWVNSTGISAKLLSKNHGKLTQLTWSQRDPDGISNENLYPIVTSHNVFRYGSLGSAFGGEGQLPCSLFDSNPGGEERFYWVLTHYSGKHCAYNHTEACYPIPGLIDVPPFSEPRSILLKDNAEVCGRNPSSSSSS